MRKTEVSFDIGTVPLTIRQQMKGATIYDSSCSANARTLFVSGTEAAFLKISRKGTLEREYKMTEFLHRHSAAPKAIAYESDSDHDYLFTEAVRGEDGTARLHIDNPGKLARVFGEYLKMLHSLPTEDCPYNNRTAELLEDAADRGINLSGLNEFNYSAVDNVIIGDRHYDISWGIWTLHYNLKTDNYSDLFLDAYGRKDIDAAGLSYFTALIKLMD